MIAKTISRDFSADSVVKISPANAGGTGSILGWGPKIPHGLWPKNQNVKLKQYCSKFNKDFKNDPQQQQNPFFFLIKMTSKSPGQSENIKVIIRLPYLLPTQMDTQVRHGPVRYLAFSLKETAL